jgi:hypothetical protein
MPKTTEELYRELLAKGDAAQQQANDLLTEYDNRAAFAYDPNADGSFQALKNQYVHQGRRAMEDTMGQAAGLTGGYGSSYSQAVGNQAYNEYLTQLNAQIPALAQQARAAYDAEGQRMLDRYSLALNAANTAYNQGRDALGDLRYEEELAYNRGQADQERAYNMVMTMLSTGQTPSADLLAQAGVSADYAKAMANYYKSQMAGYGSGSGGSSGGGRGSGGGRSSSGGSGSGSGTGTGGNGSTGGGLTTYDSIRQGLYAAAQSGNINQAYQIMEQSVGNVSAEQEQALVDLYRMLFDKDPTTGKGGGTGNGINRPNWAMATQ